MRASVRQFLEEHLAYLTARMDDSRARVEFHENDLARERMALQAWVDRRDDILAELDKADQEEQA